MEGYQNNSRRHRPKIIYLCLGFLLFNSIFVLPALAVQPSSPTVILAGSSIQDALNSSSPGDVLLLAAGTYTEQLTITTPLTLQALQPGTVLLIPSAASATTVTVAAPDVTITGISIQNPGPGLYATALSITSGHTTIQDCTFTDTCIGIACWTSDTIITGCTFARCQDEGIALLGIPDTPLTRIQITDCHFQDNCDGIELQCTSQTQIQDCTFTYNTHAGIDAINTNNNDNHITTCQFTANQLGIYIANADRTEIASCNFTTSPAYFTHATDNELTDCALDILTLQDDTSLVLRLCPPLEPSRITLADSTLSINPTLTTHLDASQAFGPAGASIWMRLSTLRHQIALA
jgi:nitrous oxidase accessory protein NosD